MPAQKDTNTPQYLDRSVTSVPSENDLSLIVDRASELMDHEDWADALDLIKTQVKGALSDERTTPAQQTLLAISAYCKSRLAILEGRWGMAAEWLLAAMNRCSPEYDPNVEPPIPYQYLLVCAAESAGGRILSYEPSQLHVMLDDKAFHDLALAYARLTQHGEHRLNEALWGVVPLRGHIMDDLWKYNEPPKGRRRAESNIVEIVYQRTQTAFNELTVSSELIMRESDFRPILREKITNFLQMLARNKALLLTGEFEAMENTRLLLGREITPLIESAKITDPVRRRDEFARFIDRATTTIATLANNSFFALSICLPPVKHLRDVATREAGFAVSALAPSVVVRQTTKRYPINLIGETIRVQIEVVNQGKGAAEGCYIGFDLPKERSLVFEKQMPLSVGSIPAGRVTNLECPIRLVDKLDVITLPVSITYTDVFGNRFSADDSIVVESQIQEPDWDTLIYSAPYGLRPVDSIRKLRGRSAQLNTLRVNTAVGTSTVLWGQKRVGKTSIAQVFELDVLDRARHLPIYLRRGDISGYSEGQIARTIASRIAAAMPDLQVEVPDEAWFGPYLTRLTDWLEKARRQGLTQSIVVILDEFDEINPALYLGQRGVNFFATLRSLSEQQLVWIFVGSERMPNIFLRHHTTLNQVEVCRVDRITDPRDIMDMIVGPVKGMLEWDSEAVDAVRQFSAGNPYFVHLICQRVLKDMYLARRTFVDRADVTLAANAIISEGSPTHWGHFWEDNAEIDPDARNQQAAKSALVLAAVGAASGSTGGTSIVTHPAIVDTIRSFEIEDADVSNHIQDIETRLVQRGVLQEIPSDKGVGYQPVVPLFGDFLSRHGHSVVCPFYKYYLSNLTVTSPAIAAVVPRQIQVLDTFPIDEDELISISEGLIYQSSRVDAVQIKAWLRQFPEEASILLAAKLLRRLKERYYFDLAHVRHAIDDAHKWLIDQMKSAGVPAVQVAGPSGRIVSVHVTYLGPASKSGADIAREFKTQKRYALCSAVDDALRWVLTDKKVERNRKFIVIVDDFVGSGGQNKGYLLDVINKLRKQNELTAWASLGRILFVPLWAYADGIDVITSEVGDLIRIQPARNLDDEDRAFSKAIDLYETEDERRYAEEVFRHIGEQLQSDNPLGWGNSQSLVVFENTVPNNTLPVFWSAGLVDEKPWRPLFERP